MDPGATTGVVELVAPGVPPSLNATRYKHWRVASAANKQWIETFEGLLMVSGMPKVDRVRARAELTFLRNARRDQVNFRTPVEKALGDALTGSGHTYVDPVTGNKRAPIFPGGRWLPDDDPAHFRFGTIAFLKGPVAQTRVVLRWWADLPPAPPMPPPGARKPRRKPSPRR